MTDTEAEPLTLATLDSDLLYSPSQVGRLFRRSPMWARNQYHAGKIVGIRSGMGNILFLGIEVKLYAGRCGWTPPAGAPLRASGGSAEKRAAKAMRRLESAAAGRKR